MNGGMQINNMGLYLNDQYMTNYGILSFGALNLDSPSFSLS